MNYKKIGKFKCTWPPLHKWQPRVIWTLIRYTMILTMVTVFGLYWYMSALSDYACYAGADHRTIGDISGIRYIRPVWWCGIGHCDRLVRTTGQSTVTVILVNVCPTLNSTSSRKPAASDCCQSASVGWLSRWSWNDSSSNVSRNIRRWLRWLADAAAATYSAFSGSVRSRERSRSQPDSMSVTPAAVVLSQWVRSSRRLCSCFISPIRCKTSSVTYGQSAKPSDCSPVALTRPEKRNK